MRSRPVRLTGGMSIGPRTAALSPGACGRAGNGTCRTRSSTPPNYAPGSRIYAETRRFGVYEERRASCAPRRRCGAHIELAEPAGNSCRSRKRSCRGARRPAPSASTTARGTYTAGRWSSARDPWAPQPLAELRIPITIERQVCTGSTRGGVTTVRRPSDLHRGEGRRHVISASRPSTDHGAVSRPRSSGKRHRLHPDTIDRTSTR